MENKKTPKNFCHLLLEELNVAMLPIAHQTPIVKSMLKWAKTAVEKPTESTTPRAWMLLMDGNWTNSAHIKNLTALKRSVQDLHPIAKKITEQMQLFSSHKAIYKEIQSFTKCYRNLPVIEPEIQLLMMNHNLFDNKELLPNLLHYVSELEMLQITANNLKKLVLHDSIVHIDLHLDSEPV